MTVADRVAELLAAVPVVEQLRGGDVDAAAEFLGLSRAAVYRLIEDGRLDCVKLEGRQRRGRGRAGSVRVRLIDLVKFQVSNERVNASAKKTKAPAGTGANGEGPHGQATRSAIQLQDA